MTVPKLFGLGILHLSALVMMGCVSGKSASIGGASGLAMVNSTELPPPSPADFMASSNPAVIGPYDVIDVSVYGQDDLALKDIQVDAGGRIAFPFVGTVDVAGLTPSEAAGIVESQLRGRFIRNPVVTINLKKTASQVVSIGGEVKRPGIYPLVGDMTLLKAIARAEGWTEFSKRREVIVYRKIGGKQYGAIYDVKAIEAGRYADPPLYSNDTVVVGFSQAQRNLRDIYTVAPALLAPLIFLLDSNN